MPKIPRLAYDPLIFADALPTFQSNLRTASQATRDRHALLPAMAPTTRQSQAALGPLYPSFDSSPYSLIDYGHNRSQVTRSDPAKSVRWSNVGSTPLLRKKVASTR